MVEAPWSSGQGLKASTPSIAQRVPTGMDLIGRLRVMQSDVNPHKAGKIVGCNIVYVSSNFIPSNPSPPRRRHSSLPRLTVRSAVTSVGYREATVPGAFRLHQFILLGDSLLVSKSGRKTMIMWLYIFYYYIDVDYMENRRYDERSDYAGGLKAGRRLSSGTSSSNKYDQSCPVMELLTSSSWEFLLSRVGHNLMVYLLQQTSIFLPFLRKKHQQVWTSSMYRAKGEQRLKSEMAEKASGGGVGEAKQEEEEEKKEPGRRRRRNCDGRETSA
ncbi:hypothetical protein Bca52824_039587 [Brassica carinata]|uniref:Telomerase reverse transcriptase n=1 Tax=Brassica carinata TaxID=52824 RepID=A0A8X7RRX0_BRACI|nr:hypothetical protein Bca52824_039587 [Brassica carinata]